MPLTLPDYQERHRGEHLICVARPTDRKGIDRAIKIAAATRRKLELIGPQAGPPGTVAYGILPRRQTLEKVAKAQAILLTPRLLSDGRGGEGLGLCIIEAASLGVPAIGCDTGGVVEALGPGLVRNDPDAQAHGDIDDLKPTFEEFKEHERQLRQHFLANPLAFDEWSSCDLHRPAHGIARDSNAAMRESDEGSEDDMDSCSGDQFLLA